MRAWIDAPRGPAAPAQAQPRAKRPKLPPPPKSNYMVGYAIFEGGGAKGITHVGALAALEREKVTLAGVAGSSAGAIVAALIAVGYSAQEIYDPGKTNILRRDPLNPLDPIDLLGRDKWGAIQRLRPLRSSLSTVVRAGLVLLALSLAAPVAAAHGHGWLAAVMIVLLPMAAVLAALAVWRFAHPIIVQRGYFDSTELRRILNGLLRDKLKAHYIANGDPDRPVPDIVRFSDIDPDDGNVRQCRRLKIIVSDARTREPVTFDRTTGAVSVADAVAASSAIPIVFAPPEIEGAPRAATYVDGGLVANLPVWAFAREKRHLERDEGIVVPIFAFTLGDPVAPDTAPRAPVTITPGPIARFRQFLVDVIRTGIFGSQAIAYGLTSDLVVVPLPSSLRTLDFDCLADAADQAYFEGFNTAAATLARRRLTEALLKKLLADLGADVRIQLAARNLCVIDPATRLRLCLIDPVQRHQKNVDSFRVVASAGMDDDADDRLEIDGRGEGAARAWREGRPIFAADLTVASPRQLVMTKYEHALVWPGLKSMIALPIYARPDIVSGLGQLPQRLLCLDSNCDLEPAFKDVAFRLWLAERSVLLSRTLIREVIDGQFEDL